MKIPKQENSKGSAQHSKLWFYLYKWNKKPMITWFGSFANCKGESQILNLSLEYNKRKGRVNPNSLLSKNWKNKWRKQSLITNQPYCALDD